MDEKEIIIAEVRQELIEKLEFLEETNDDSLQRMINESLKEKSREQYISIKDRQNIARQIFDSMRKLGILEEFIENPDVTEIMINGPKCIFYEKAGRLYKSDKQFENEETLRNVIQKIVAQCNRVVNESSPIVDARLSDGSRVNCVLDPIALNGPILTIRRFPKRPYLMNDLIEKGSLNKETAELLRKLVVAGYNILVSGGTGSGKTTFLNALSAYIPKDERIITIEDSAELQIQGIENLVRMETKNANIEGVTPITIRDLIKSSLRMRPDRIVVGEVRGAEAMDMICSAMNCGHDGSMSTVHANSAADSISRLETMILTAAPLPLYAIRRQIGSGVDIVIQLGRMRDKTRKVLEIVELNCIGDDVDINPLFRFVEDDYSAERVSGQLTKVGDLKNDSKLKAAGICL
ncbi:CpaF family protein [Lacrimispora saccharolytica]|uniref:CpaF family protein n=1 Tax=Lacrimispora saccharolytica TaxID=84030 RepID=UPI00265CC361|nr:CpaF family protein [Lacrimispora saccharolytica]MBS7329934.1 CpaF family protein [Lachnospiraceae bacterium]MCF2656778.1 CpaF family protein [Lacrimispora saccharolytica]MCI7557737.1 CpaF family protein [Lachnospiraceae bacterium]MDD7548750.1 CpaF family protein [Lachnospiraceae bacterium]